MKSLMLFLQEVLKDLGTWCCTSTDRDLKTIARRVEHEGLSFLTITLSTFGKDFQKSLDQGFVGPSQFCGFHRAGGLPRFLGGFLDLVFDRATGRLLDEPSVTAIWAIRQISLMWSKIELECTPARRQAAFDKFIECEGNVRENDKNLDPILLDRFQRIGSLLWGDVFCYVDRKIYELDIVPKHGPGSTADRLLANAKWKQSEWTERLDRVFPAGEFLLPNWRYYKYLSDVHFLEPGAERPVRVVDVPKTLETPRIIAIEPTAMQYMQQGILAAIREALSRSDIPRCFVGNEDQMPNRRLACRGSSDGTLATLDLKEASDRVSNQHVRGLLRNHRYLAEAVEASRSRKADVPGHGVIRLAKFASMGSALTFAMEEVVFTTLIFLGIERELNRPITLKDIRSYKGRVRAFGDDLIIPVEHVQSVVRTLEDFGLLVNRNKSFWLGKFRESCGGDYYDGHEINIVRVRSLLPSHRRHVPEIVRTVALRNHCYTNGLWNAAAHLDGVLGRLIPMPRVSETSPMLGRHSFLGYETQRICPELHRPLVKGWRVSPDIPVSQLDDRFALLKVLVTRQSAGGDSSNDPFLAVLKGLPTLEADHLERAGRPKRVNTKLGWGPPY